MIKKFRYSEKAQEDIAYWKKTGNVKVQKKIQEILQSIQENPFQGIGKPEPLKHELSGSWSRRIDREHRIVYRVMDDLIQVQSLKGHY